MKAIWKGIVIAESDDTVIVENNHYFPAESINLEFFSPSEASSICPWKGTASYYHVTVDGETNKDSAWYYVTPSDAAKEITGRVAFWKGIQIAS